MDQKKRPARKRKTPVSRQKAIKASLAIADKKGLEALTMRKLAKALRIEAMSLYYHFRDKDEIFDGMVDQVFTEIGLASMEVDWRISMKQRAFAVRKALERHPWALGVMESRPNIGPAIAAHHNSVIGALRKAGFSVGLASHAFSVIDAFIFGFILQERHLPFDTPEELSDIAESALKAFQEDKFPYFSEMITAHVLKPGYSYSAEFEFGLDLIIESLELRRTAENKAIP